MGRILFLFTFLFAALALVLRHYNHAHWSELALGTAAISAVLGALISLRHPFADIIEDMRRLAD